MKRVILVQIVVFVAWACIEIYAVRSCTEMAKKNREMIGQWQQSAIAFELTVAEVARREKRLDKTQTRLYEMFDAARKHECICCGERAH